MDKVAKNIALLSQSHQLDQRSVVKIKSQKGLKYNIFGQFITYILNVLSLLILARLLNPEMFGLLAIAAIYTSFLTFISDLGLSTAVIQEKKITQAQLSTIFFINTIIGLFLFLVSLLIVHFPALLYDNDDLVIIIPFMGSIFLFNSIKLLHHALLKKEHCFKEIQYSSVISQFVSIIICITMAYLNYGYWSLVTMHISQSLIEMVLLLWFSKWIPSFQFKIKETFDLLKVGYNMTIATLANYFSKKVDQMIIADFSMYELGLYSKAYKICTIPMQIIRSTLVDVGLPSICALDNSNDKIDIYKSIVLSASLILFPLALILILIPGLITSVVLGENWLNSAKYLEILGFILFLQPLLATRGLIFIGFSKTKQYMLSNIVIAIIIISAFVLGAYMNKSYGVAVAFVIANYIIIAPLLYYTYRGTQISIFSSIRILFPSITGTLVILSLNLIVQPIELLISYNISNIITLLIYLKISFLIYFITLICFKNSRDKIIAFISIIFNLKIFKI